MTVGGKPRERKNKRKTERNTESRIHREIERDGDLERRRRETKRLERG